MGYTSFSNLPLSAYNELSSKVEDRVYFINDEGTIRLNEVTYGAGGSGGDKIYVEPDYLTFTAIESNLTIALNKSSTNAGLSAILEYSTDGGNTWTNYTWNETSGAVITLTNAGDNVKFRGDNATFSIGADDFYRFTTGPNMQKAIFAVSGNIMSLLDKTCLSITIPNEYCFNYLFQGCYLANVPKFPAMNLKKYCYRRMFYDNYYLSGKLDLPAEDAADGCYSQMFYQARVAFNEVKIGLKTCHGLGSMFFGNARNFKPAMTVNFTEWDTNIHRLRKLAIFYVCVSKWNILLPLWTRHIK